MRVLVAVAFLCGLTAGGACRPPDAPTQRTAMATTSLIPLQRLVVPPRASSSGLPPALVLVHGVGSNERDLAGLADRLDSRFVVHSLRAPIPMGPDAFGWFKVTFTEHGPVHDVDGATAARARLVDTLRTLKAGGTVDPDQIYLLGFSQGAILGIATALGEPGLVRGVVAVAGRTLPEVQQAVAGRKLSGTSVLLVHGRDDRKLPFALGEQSRTILEQSGLPLTWRPHDGGHTITPAMLRDIDGWLRDQLDGRQNR